MYRRSSIYLKFAIIPRAQYHKMFTKIFPAFGKFCFLFSIGNMKSFFAKLQKTDVGLVLFCSFFFFTFPLCAQKTIPKGKFLTDSIEVGKPFLYSLSYYHAPGKEVFFPDTTFDFSPFEIISQKSFNSSTDEKRILRSTALFII